DRGERRVAAVAPAHHGDARGIDVGPRAEPGVDGGDVGDRVFALVLVVEVRVLLPVAGRAANVGLRDDVPVPDEELHHWIEERLRLRFRTTVDGDDGRPFSGRAFRAK